MFYLDTSAAAKLVLVEQGSSALRRWLEPRDGRLCSSDILRTELQRVVRREAPESIGRARSVLGALSLVRLSAETYERASGLGPVELRSLDALHLAAAMEMGDELEGIVTYDDRLAEGAAANGIRVVSPA